MAGSTGGMNILPQYQGDYYSLQNKQALAQALMQSAMQPQQIQATGSGPYTVMPKYSIGGGLAQLGQALLAGRMQNQVSEGMNNLGQSQWNSLVGSPAPTSDASGATENPFQSGSGGGAGSLAQALSSSGAPQKQSSGGMLAPGSALNPSGMDASKAAYLYLNMPFSDYAKEFVAPYVKPTDATLMARQAGIDPSQANAGALFKNNYVAPVTGTGTFRDPRTMQPVAFNPDVPAGATPLFDASGNVAAVKPIQGAQGVMQGNAAAAAAGTAQFKPIQVYNPRTQQMEYSNEASVTNPGQPSSGNLSDIFLQQESSGGRTAPDNPFQIQKGTFDMHARPGESWSNVADRNTVAQRMLSGYHQKYGGDLGRIATAYFSGEGNVAPPGGATPYLRDVADKNGKSVSSYVGDIASRAAGGSQGRYSAGPSLGEQANAESMVKGQIDTMQKSYQNLQTVRSGAPAALQDVENMSKLAAGASPTTLGEAGAKFAGLFSSDAAEYEKSRDNLVTNLGSQLGINSDAARSLVYGSIPSYGAPKQAVQNGLDTLKGQIQTRLLKSDFLSNSYASGDAKQYNRLENSFDQNVNPKIANIITMPSSPQRGAALQSAIKDPKMREKLEWAANNGLLK